MTIDLATSEGILSDYSLIFDDESSLSTIYTPILTAEGVVTITATGASFTGSIDISVELLLEATRIELDADPPTIPVDGGTEGTSIITATIKDDGGNTVHNFIGTVTFSMSLDAEFVLGELPGTKTIDCINGIATIELVSGSIPGTCQIQAENGSLTIPSKTIDVGFYSTATHILLTAVPVHIHVGGGNEGTSILTASIKDSEGTTVYNYDGDVLFSFLSGYNSTAKFKFVNNPSYSVPVFHGSASVYLLSLNNSGDAVLKAEDDPSVFLTPDESTLYIQKTLKEPVPPDDYINVTNDNDKKGVSFNIEVLGGDMQIDKMNISWEPNAGEHLISVEFASVEVFSGSISSGNDIEFTDIFLSEGISNIHLSFVEGITDKEFTITFYPHVSDYNPSSCEINFNN